MNTTSQTEWIDALIAQLHAADDRGDQERFLHLLDAARRLKVANAHGIAQVLNSEDWQSDFASTASTMFNDLWPAR